MTEPFLCPNCGAVVAPKALSCRECGSDRSTGWSKSADYAHLIPDDEGLPPAPAPRSWTKLSIAAIAVMTAGFLVWAQGVRWALYLVPVLIILVLVFRGRAFRPSERALFNELLVLCQHNRELAERLIDAEVKRLPGRSRAELIQRAIDRLTRGRR